MKPLVSVIVASYNYQDYIGETLDSILAQSYDNFEVIVVDDGSKDKSVDVIKKYVSKDKRVKLYQHDGGVNRGLPETIKLALKHSNGEWIAFCEADDYWDKNYLKEKIAYAAKYPEAAIITNALQMFGDEKEIKIREKILAKSCGSLLKKTGPVDAFYMFYYNNALSTFSAVMVRKDALMECDFKSEIPAWLDWWLWRQIAFKHKVGGINKKLTFWRVHAGSYNTSSKGKDTSKRMIEKGNEILYKKYGPEFKKRYCSLVPRFVGRFLKKKSFYVQQKGDYLRISLLGISLFKIKNNKQ